MAKSAISRCWQISTRSSERRSALSCVRVAAFAELYTALKASGYFSLVSVITSGNPRCEAKIHTLMNISYACIEIVQGGEYSVGLVAKTRLKKCNMISPFQECMCLKRLEESEVVCPPSRMEIVPHKSDPLRPM